MEGQCPKSEIDFHGIIASDSFSGGIPVIYVFLNEGEIFIVVTLLCIAFREAGGQDQSSLHCRVSVEPVVNDDIEKILETLRPAFGYGVHYGLAQSFLQPRG